MDNVDNYHKALILLVFLMCIKINVKIKEIIFQVTKKQQDHAEEINIILLFCAVLLSEKVFSDIYNIAGPHSDYKVTACTVF